MQTLDVIFNSKGGMSLEIYETSKENINIWKKKKDKVDRFFFNT
jgi:hypothetical protein